MCVSGWSDIGVTLTPQELAEVLCAAGWSGSVSVVELFGWSHPGWWSNGRLTEFGNGFVCLSGVGLLFREAGVRLVLDEFLEAVK